MIDGVVHPAFILLAGAALVGLTRGHLRSAVLFAAPLATLWALWQIPDGVVATAQFLGYEIQPIEGSPVRRLFATIFAIMAFTGGLFAFRQARWYEGVEFGLYAVAAIEDVAHRYEFHCRAARQIAEEYFDSGAVLRSLIDRAMNHAAAGTPSANQARRRSPEG